MVQALLKTHRPVESFCILRVRYRTEGWAKSSEEKTKDQIPPLLATSALRQHRGHLDVGVPHPLNSVRRKSIKAVKHSSGRTGPTSALWLRGCRRQLSSSRVGWQAVAARQGARRLYIIALDLLQASVVAEDS